MSNFDRAIELLSSAELPGRTLHPLQVEEIALDLLEAGLLAPDLPEPYRPGVFKAISPYLGIRSVQATEGQITLHGYRTRHTSVGEARRLALALLAACEYAEKEQDSER